MVIHHRIYFTVQFVPQSFLLIILKFLFFRSIKSFEYLIIIYVCSVLSFLGPSQSPDSFYVTATTSTSITANWQLPSADGRNGIIRGFKLFYKRKDDASSPTILTINSAGILTRRVTGLDIYTEYKFQVSAFTSAGDGPKSTVLIKRTKEDGKELKKNSIFLFILGY